MQKKKVFPVLGEIPTNCFFPKNIFAPQIITVFLLSKKKNFFNSNLCNFTVN